MSQDYQIDVISRSVNASIWWTILKKHHDMQRIDESKIKEIIDKQSEMLSKSNKWFRSQSGGHQMAKDSLLILSLVLATT